MTIYAFCAKNAISALYVNVLFENFRFDELGFHRVQAFVHPDDSPSRALIEKLGFRLEGRLRDNLRVGDDWRDDMLYALLATERRSNQALAPAERP